jgi:NAD(P)-dependent dehydrogenase (short-subunit alcohol dehydrogenase family)
MQSMDFFSGKVVVVTGGTDGIGKALVEQLLNAGALVSTCGRKQDKIYQLQKEFPNSSLHCMVTDVSSENDCRLFIERTCAAFGGIDILINNASAISLTSTEDTESKRFDLMHSINVRGTFLVSKHCIPHLKKGNNPHIITLSPPLNLDPKWFGSHLAYTISKYDMSMIAIGLAEELKQYKIASNALWPRTTIATAAVMNLLGGQMLINMSRTPEILADAAYYILKRPSGQCTGNCYLDEAVLAEEGITDLAGYSVVPGAHLYTDLFL